MKGVLNNIYDFRQWFRNSLVYRLITILIFILMVSMPVLVLRTGLQTNPQLFEFYYDTYLRLFPIFVIVFCMMFQEFNKKEGYFYIGLLILLHLIAFNQNYRTEVLYLFTTMLVIKEEKMLTIAKILLIVYGLLFMVITGLSLLNIAPNYFPIYFESHLRSRFSLGFVHPNSTGAAFLSFLFLVFLTFGQKLKVWLIFLLLGALLVMNYYVDSRTVFYLGLMLFGYVLLDKLNEKGSRLLRKLTELTALVTPLLLLIFSYVTAYFFNPEISTFQMLNRLLSSRLTLSHRFVMEYPLRPFGQVVHFYITETEWNVLDNGYLNVMLNLGIIYILFILCFTGYIIFRLNKMGYRYAPLIGILVYIYGLTEQSFMTIPFNILLLFGGALLAESKSLRDSQINQ